MKSIRSINLISASLVILSLSFVLEVKAQSLTQKETRIPERTDFKRKLAELAPQILEGYAQYQQSKWLRAQLSGDTIFTAPRRGVVAGGGLGKPMSMGASAGFGGPYGAGVYGMIDDATTPITPKVNSSDDSAKAIRVKIDEAQRTLMAREDYVDLITLDIARKRDAVLDLDEQIASARAANQATAALEKERREISGDIDLYLEGRTHARAGKTESLKILGKLQKELDAEEGKSQGWTLAETQAEKAVAAKAGFKCQDGERTVAKSGSNLNNFGCLDSKGFMTKQAMRIAGTDLLNTQTSYERESGKLTKVTTTDSEGKVISETTFGPKEETQKIYSNGSIQSSCTAYNDQGWRPASGGDASQGSGADASSGTSR